MKSLILILTLVFSANIFALKGAQHVELTANMVDIKGKNYLAISTKNEKGWHTYWKNPGEAGLPLNFKFFINNTEMNLHKMEWPTPHRYLEDGGAVAYGYGGINTFYFGINDNQLKTLMGKSLLVKGTWLVCSNICIPGKGELTVNYNSDNETVKIDGSKFQISNKVVRNSFSKLPRAGAVPKFVELYLNKDNSKENQLILFYTIKGNINKFDDKRNILTPFPALPFNYRPETLTYDQSSNTTYGKMLVEWDGEYQEPEWPLDKDGIFKKPMVVDFLIQSTTGNDIVIQKKFKQFSLTGDKALNSYFKDLKAKKKVNQSSIASNSNIFTILLFAFLGGLILNLMPCVLPVISLKLFGLIVHSDESQKSILRHNLAYTAGVLVTFFALGGIVIGLKSAGTTVGWGFQLQSPMFVFVMMLVLFILSLNMFGLFEFMTPGGKTLGNAELKSGVSGDFMSGVLATILSTPCSAPFLGTALTYAFTTGTVNIFLTFTFIGLGLSFPFILTGFFPKMISFLPKPGMWMEKLKNFLGLTLILTFVWLYDVLSNLIDFSFSGIYINSIFVLIFFAFFAQKKITKNKLTKIIFFLLPVVLLMSLVKNNGFAVADNSNSSSTNSTNGLEWQPWSVEKMNELGKNGELVFVDFTAKWCLTCKVNKKLVFTSDGFKKLVEKKKIKLLIADWTKRDDKITEFLMSHGIVGVPAYFVINKKGKLKHLGETISVNKVSDSL